MYIILAYNMSTANNNHIITRYLVATLGLFLVGFGVALTIVANLGTAPLSCVAYVFNLRFPSVSVGTFILAVNMVYMLVQILVLRKRFKLKYLMQIPASVLFSYLVDLSLWMMAWLHPEGLLPRMVLTLLAGGITAVGVSLEVLSDAWMLSAEMTVSSIAEVSGRKFDNVKIAMDTLMVVIAGALAWIFFGTPFGAGEFHNAADVMLSRAPGVVIGLGTLIMAFLPGFLMRFVQPVMGRFYGTARK